MPQDFANKPRKPTVKKRVHAAGRSNTRQGSSPGTWFFSGLLCGVFLSGLVWLASLQPEVAATFSKVTEPGAAEADSDKPEPRFDFYTILPEQSLAVELDAANINAARVNQSMDQYLLQAGSFKQADDADRRRAELLLLSLDARVEETLGDNGRWFRVYIGPFQSRSEIARARSLTAQQGIDTLLLKPPKQG